MAAILKVRKPDGTYVDVPSLVGPPGKTGAAGKSGVYRGEDEPTDPDINVWVRPSGTPTGVIDTKAREDIAQIEARQNILIGNVNGNPVSVGDAFAAPLCGLHIYGRSRQDGTPSADNPVPIVAAGADGTLQVKITGANLLDFEKAASENANAEFTFENGILAVKALNKQGWAGIFIPLPDECAGKQIFFRRTIDSNPNRLKSLIQMRYSLNGKTVYFSSTSILKIPEGASNIRYNVMARNENTAAEGTITVQYPVVCYGSALLPYEPYHEQVITVQTSGGLNGIPVSSGGNYTDKSGQQWICDEIDLERGVYIKRIYAADLTGTTGSDLSDGGLGFVDINLPYPLGNLAFMCEQYPAHIQTKGGDTYWKLASATIVTISNKKNIVRIYDTASKAVTARVLYDLETPIETPLTAEEIAAYKALTAYAQTTVVQAKNVAGIRLDYQQDVNLVIKKLEDALVATTAS